MVSFQTSLNTRFPGPGGEETALCAESSQTHLKSMTDACGNSPHKQASLPSPPPSPGLPTNPNPTPGSQPQPAPPAFTLPWGVGAAQGLAAPS